MDINVLDAFAKELTELCNRYKIEIYTDGGMEYMSLNPTKEDIAYYAHESDGYGGTKKYSLYS